MIDREEEREEKLRREKECEEVPWTFRPSKPQRLHAETKEKHSLVWFSKFYFTLLLGPLGHLLAGRIPPPALRFRVK